MQLSRIHGAAGDQRTFRYGELPVSSLGRGVCQVRLGREATTVAEGVTSAP
jgi:hypothetical protein